MTRLYAQVKRNAVDGSTRCKSREAERERISKFPQPFVTVLSLSILILLAVHLSKSLMLILPTMNLLSPFSIPLASNTLFPSLLPSSAVLMLIVPNMIFLILISSNPSLSFLRRQQPFPPLHSVNPLRLVPESPHPPLTLPLPLLPPATSTLQEFWEQARLAQSALLNTRGQEEQSH